MTQWMAAAAVAVSLMATPASALLLSVQLDADGGQLGPIAVDVSIESDFDRDQTDSTDGLTVTSLSPALDDPLRYDFSQSAGALQIGGGFVSRLATDGNDFIFILFDVFTDPVVTVAVDSASTLSGSGTLTVNSLAVTQHVPLPASGLLLLAGLGLLAARRRA